MKKVKPSELESLLAKLVESKQLPMNQAHAIYLRHIEKKSHEEVAGITGVKVYAAKKRQQLKKLGFDIGRVRNVTPVGKHVPTCKDVTQRKDVDIEFDYEPLIKRYADEMLMTFDEALQFLGTRNNLECAASLLGIEMPSYRHGTARFHIETLDKYLRKHGYIIEQKFEPGLEQYLRGIAG
jgi:hypothetical protein